MSETGSPGDTGNKATALAPPGDPRPLPDGFVRRDCEVNGTRLSYLLGGHGPVVVLLHGWPQTARAWRHLLRPLAAAGFTVLAPDLRGAGRSAHSQGGYDKDNQAEDLRQLLDTTGLGPHVHLVGHDIGGMVAFAYARLYPSEVQRLVLIELTVPGLGLEEAMDVAHGGLWHFGFFMTPEVPELLLDGHEREFFTWWYAQFTHASGAINPVEIDDVVQVYSGRDALKAGFSQYRTLLADGRTIRAWVDAGGRLRLPVLAVGGEYGVGAGLADAVRRAAPQTRGLIVQGSGHFVPEEAPEALLASLLAFLR